MTTDNGNKGGLIECGRCGKFFAPHNTYEDAMNEYIENFGIVAATEDEGVVICDECYEEIDPKKFPEKVKQTNDEIMNKKLN